MPIYSHSQLSVYEQCPLKYKLQYLDKVEREEIEGIEAFLGNRVHETLEKCYYDLKFTKLNTSGDLLSFYDEAWQKNWHDSIVITKPGLTTENYRALGAKLIETYYKRYAPFDRDITIRTEMALHFSLDDDKKYRMRGFIDRLARSRDGAYEIHDYKTSSHLPGQEEADNDRQLALYQIGIQKKWPDAKNIRLIWHYLAFDTELVSSRSPEAISELAQDTIRLIDEIQAAKDFPPRECWLCDWCEFPEYCPQRKHIFKVEALPPNEYLKEPGVVLVNKYAQLKEQESAISGEIDKVRQAIIEYAKNEQVNVMRGSDRLVKVKFDEKLKFPGKNSDGRQELDGAIVEAGKWMEVSELDTSALTRTLETGDTVKSLSVGIENKKRDRAIYPKVSTQKTYCEGGLS